MSIILTKAGQWRPDLDVRIKVLVKAPKPTNSRPLKRPINITSSDPVEEPPIKSHTTRTDKLLERQRAKIDTFTIIGNYDHQLLQRWQYIDKRCRNHNGWCIVDYSGKHYNIDYTQQSIWARVIINYKDLVTIERPPPSLYRFWIESQGAITNESRQPIKQIQKQEEKEEKLEFRDMLSTYMAFNKQQLEMQLADRMTDQMERMGAR